jgi:hypothetical protein
VCHADSALRGLSVAAVAGLGAGGNITLSICFDRIAEIVNVLIDIQMGIVLG